MPPGPICAENPLTEDLDRTQPKGPDCWHKAFGVGGEFALVTPDGRILSIAIFLPVLGCALLAEPLAELVERQRKPRGQLG